MSDRNTSPEALACLRTHLEAENRHDLAAIMETYVASPRVTINGHEFRGADAVRLFHDRFGFGGNGAFSEVTVRERARHPCGSVVVLEQLLSGVHSGRWQGHQPTGRKFEVCVCTVYAFSPQAKLDSEDVYFDSHLLRQQLGLTGAA